MDNSQNVKRLAKNTILLYVRMFITMIISLYTSRVILATLGVEDYGIYNVVGGFIAMFGIITATLNIAINRFLTFELGTGDKDRLKRVFSTSITIQILLSIIVIIIAETVGLWYINNVMVIPPERLVAANWCYQFSIVSCLAGLIVVPYNSTIIAHEDMSIYAFMGIFNSVFALIVAFLIGISPIDRLVFYGFLLMLCSIINFLVYMFYSKRHYEEACFRITFDKEMFRSMFGFAGWNFIGAGGYLMVMQGGNLLINYFFGPAVNAARGISNSVNTAIKQFGMNFTVALKPQITKSYASGDYNYMYNLIYRGSKLSVFMMLFISVPVLLNTPFILSVWLKEVPDHAVLFTQLAIIYTLVEMVDGPLITTILATGKIKTYQIVEGVLQCFNLLIAWLLLYLGAIPEIVLVVCIVTIHLTLLVKTLVLRRYVNLGVRDFFLKVYMRVLVTALLGFVIPYLLHALLPYGWSNFIFTSCASVIFMGGAMLYIGCDHSERAFVYSNIKKFIGNFIGKTE